MPDKNYLSIWYKTRDLVIAIGSSPRTPDSGIIGREGELKTSDAKRGKMILNVKSSTSPSSSFGIPAYVCYFISFRYQKRGCFSGQTAK